MEWSNIDLLIKIVFQGIAITLLTVIVLYILFRVISTACFKSKEEYIRRVKEYEEE